MRGYAGSASLEGGQWARSKEQVEFYKRHHTGMFCACPYGDIPPRKGAIAAQQECRAMCCDYKKSLTKEPRK